MKLNGFFSSSFSFPSPLILDIPGVQVCTRGGCHCFPRHEQRKQRTPHSLWWAMCSCVGFNVTRHEAAVKSQLTSVVPFTQWWSGEISVGSTFTSPLHACSCTHTVWACVPPTSTVLWLYVTANTSVHRISSSVITMIKVDWAIMQGFVIRGIC